MFLVMQASFLLDEKSVMWSLGMFLVYLRLRSPVV